MKTMIRAFAAMLALVASLQVAPALGALRVGQTNPFTAPARAALQIDRVLRAASEADGFAGEVLVARDGATILDRGYGAMTGSHIARISPSTALPLAGQSFIFLSAAILRLQQQGRLHLDTSICRYLSPCAGTWQPITVAALLGHGLRAPSPPRFALAAPRGYPAGSTFSAPAARVAASIITRASRQPWPVYLQRDLFRPLGMMHTGLSRGGPNSARIDLSSTVDDVYRWYDAMLSCSAVVSLDELSAALRPDRRLLVPVQGQSSLQITGDENGASSEIRFIPQRQVAIIVIAVRGGSRQMLDAIQRILL